MTGEGFIERLDAAVRELRESSEGTVGDEQIDRHLYDRASIVPVAGQAPGRVTAPGRRTDDGRRCDLLAVRGADGSCTFRGPGEPGVRMTADIAAGLAEWILARAR